MYGVRILEPGPWVVGPQYFLFGSNREFYGYLIEKYILVESLARISKLVLMSLASKYIRTIILHLAKESQMD
jgi:hypothetical protein